MPSSGGQSDTHWFHWFFPAAPSCCWIVEKVVDLQSCSLTDDGLQLSRGSVAQLLDTAEALQQSQSLDTAHPGDLLDHSQDQGVQQLK